ncbi:hypothetical protein Q7P35_003553 [Cladosporium inversicolor]
MSFSTENIRHFQWEAHQVQTYVSQAMAALSQDACTSRAFDTFDERKEAVRDVLKFTWCPLFEGLLTRVTVEHERTYPKDVAASHATQDVTAAVTPTRNGNSDSSEKLHRRREIFVFSPSGHLIDIVSEEPDVDDEPDVPRLQAQPSSSSREETTIQEEGSWEQGQAFFGVESNEAFARDLQAELKGKK